VARRPDKLRAMHPLSVFSTGLHDLTWPDALRWLSDQEVQHLELGCGAYPGTKFAHAQQLCEDPEGRALLQSELQAHGITLAALSCHGNPLHPDEDIAALHRADFEAALELASDLEVPVLVGFSGQGGEPGCSIPNWPVATWPFEYAELREWQWEEQVIPYWQPVAARAAELGVRIALELHGGFAVHSPGSLLRLREACGPALCANLDPSHLWWQHIDPVRAIQLLGQAVAHVHLKDTVFNADALALHGLLDPTPMDRPQERAWRFALPGEGHDADTWRTVLKALDDVGYAGVLSIEHEAPMPPLAGIADTLKFMRSL